MWTLLFGSTAIAAKVSIRVRLFEMFRGLSNSEAEADRAARHIKMAQTTAERTWI